MPKKQTSDVSKEHIVAFWKCMYVDRYKHVFPETCHDVVLSQSQLWLARSIQWTKTVYFTTMTGCFPRCNSTFSNTYHCALSEIHLCASTSLSFQNLPVLCFSENQMCYHCSTPKTRGPFQKHAVECPSSNSAFLPKTHSVFSDMHPGAFSTNA